MAVTDQTVWDDTNQHDSLIVSLLTYHSEHAGAHGKMQNRYIQALYLSAGYSDCERGIYARKRWNNENVLFIQYVLLYSFMIISVVVIIGLIKSLHKNNKSKAIAWPSEGVTSKRSSN